MRVFIKIDSIRIAVHIVNIAAKRYSATGLQLKEWFILVDAGSNALAADAAPTVFSGQHNTLATPWCSLSYAHDEEDVVKVKVVANIITKQVYKSTIFSRLLKLAHIAPIPLYSLFIVATVFAAEVLVAEVLVTEAVATVAVRLPKLAHIVTTLWCNLSSVATLISMIMAIELVTVIVNILAMLKLAHIAPTLLNSLFAKVIAKAEELLVVPIVATVAFTRLTRQHSRPTIL